MVQKILKNIYQVGSRDWDRRLFDELIPLPDGTSYNSYLIKGSKKTVLIDTVDPDKTIELKENLKKLKIKNIDYVIPNHAEQDHSGAIPDILEMYEGAKVITNEKCKIFLKDLLPIKEERFVTVDDGETVSLGDKTLEFILTPWVHWPETMSTYLKEDKILFSCDFFGSHLATSDIFVTNEQKVIDDAKRYYAEIMMPFRTIIKKNMEKIKDIDIKYIAPSHGPVYDKPRTILNAYREWISDSVNNTVVIPYVSMHGSTEEIVHYFLNKLTEKGISVKPFNLTKTDLGELAMAIVDAATIVIATPTVLAGPHPAAAYAAFLVNALKPKTRFATVIGSFGWGGKTVEIIKNNLNNLKAEFLDPVLIKGFPEKDDFNSIDHLANSIHSSHKKINIIKGG